MAARDKNNEWYQHEGLDRTHTLLVMLQELIGYCDSDTPLEDLHPSVWSDECKIELIKVTESLGTLYQLIGKWGDDKYFDDCDTVPQDEELEIMLHNMRKDLGDRYE